MTDTDLTEVLDTDTVQTHSAGGTAAGVLDFPCAVRRLENGHTIVCDAGTETGQGSELIEIDGLGNVVWHGSCEYRFAHGVEPLGCGRYLVADTSNDRIVESDRDGNMLFSSDQWSDGSGLLSDGTHLRYPNNIAVDPNDLIWITDRNNDRFVVTDRSGTVHRSFGGGLSRPHNCEPLPGGGAIIADSDGNRVLEIDADGNTVWEYADGLNWPRDANRLADGNTLIVDSKNSRVIEVSPGGDIVWEFAVDYFSNFYEAHRLPGGTTLISDQQHKQILEVDRHREVVWSFRNYERETPVNSRLRNGFLTRHGDDGFPAHWSLLRRFSEGGGQFAWATDERNSPAAALLYDRGGGLALQQTVEVVPGERYSVGGRISTIGLDNGFACIQMAFRDAEDGFLCDAADAPRGAVVSGTEPWLDDEFVAVAPAGASHADVRLFITGSGVALFSQVRCFV